MVEEEKEEEEEEEEEAETIVGPPLLPDIRCHACTGVDC